MNRKINLQNFAVFPCKGNLKIPATPNGFKDAKFNADVELLLEKGYNIGIWCKQSKLIVLDADMDEQRGLNGIAELQELEQKLCPLPKDGLIVKTPRNGRHYYFNSEGIFNPIGKIRKAIDVKFNGYTLFPPSKVSGKPYEILGGVEADGAPIIKSLPKIWIEYINKSNFKSRKAFENKTHENQPRKVIDGDFKVLFERCLFVRQCILGAKNLEEPAWHHFSRILNSFSNGLELFDYYSQPHPEYDKEKTKKKFENASKYSFSCNSIAKIFEGCSKCKKEIKNGK